jgi:hypothetical protein
MCKHTLKVFLSEPRSGGEAGRFARLAGVEGTSFLDLKTGGISADDPNQEPIGFSVFFPSSCVYFNDE